MTKLRLLIVLFAALFVWNANAQNAVNDKVISEMLTELNAKSKNSAEFAGFFNAYKEALNQKKYKLALETITKAIEREPKLMVLYELRGRLKAILGDAKGAITDFDKIIAAEPNFVSFFNRGTTKIDILDYKGALADYNQSVKLQPNYPDTYTNRGMVKIKLKDNKGAMQDFDKALSFNPKSIEAKKNLEMARRAVNGDALAADTTRLNIKGSNSAESNYLTKKLDIYNAYIDLHPDNTDARYYRADLRIDLNDFKGAIADYTKVIELRPTSDSYAKRAELYYDLGDFKHAITDYSAALSSEKDKNYYNKRGEANFKLGKNTSALLDFNAAIRMDDKYTAALTNRGKLHEKKGNLNDALDDYTTALSYENKNVFLENRIRDIKAKIKENRKQISIFSQYIDYKPTDAGPYYDRGMAYKSLRDNLNAVADFNKAIELDAMLYDAYKARAEVKEETNDFVGMINDYKKYIDLKPNDIDVLITLANVLVMDKQYTDALNYVSTAIKLNPADMTLYLFRATIYDQSKNFKGAIADYKNYISRKPNELDVQFKLAVVQRKSLNPDAAIRTLDAIILKNSDYTEAYYERAKLKSNFKSDIKGACADWKIAKKMGHKAAEILWNDECSN